MAESMFVVFALLAFVLLHTVCRNIKWHVAPVGWGERG